jgi:hypothetical protein
MQATRSTSPRCALNGEKNAADGRRSRGVRGKRSDHSAHSLTTLWDREIRWHKRQIRRLSHARLGTKLVQQMLNLQAIAEMHHNISSDAGEYYRTRQTGHAQQAARRNGQLGLAPRRPCLHGAEQNFSIVSNLLCPCSPSAAKCP